MKGSYGVFRYRRVLTLDAGCMASASRMQDFKHISYPHSVRSVMKDAAPAKVSVCNEPRDGSEPQDVDA
jgi:hypothetical protein